MASISLEWVAGYDMKDGNGMVYNFVVSLDDGSLTPDGSANARPRYTIPVTPGALPHTYYNVPIVLAYQNCFTPTILDVVDDWVFYLPGRPKPRLWRDEILEVGRREQPPVFVGDVFFGGSLKGLDLRYCVVSNCILDRCDFQECWIINCTGGVANARPSISYVRRQDGFSHYQAGVRLPQPGVNWHEMLRLVYRSAAFRASQSLGPLDACPPAVPSSHVPPSSSALAIPPAPGSSPVTPENRSPDVSGASSPPTTPEDRFPDTLGPTPGNQSTSISAPPSSSIIPDWKALDALYRRCPNPYGYVGQGRPSRSFANQNAGISV